MNFKESCQNIRNVPKMYSEPELHCNNRNRSTCPWRYLWSMTFFFFFFHFINWQVQNSRKKPEPFTRAVKGTGASVLLLGAFCDEFVVLLYPDESGLFQDDDVTNHSVQKGVCHIIFPHSSDLMPETLNWMVKQRSLPSSLTTKEEITG